MKLETFFEKFDQFADVPNAVGKMRELVLQWAIQGRLVRQDAGDEPASSLIRSAVVARRQLVAAKVVRDETPALNFLKQLDSELPSGWIRAPLSVYVAVIMGQSPPSCAYNKSRNGLPFYQGKAQFGRLYPTATDWCTQPTKIGLPGDVVISVRAPVGPTNVLQEKSCIGRGLTALRSLGGDQMYLLYVLRALERSIASMGVGSTFVAISKGDLDGFQIPVPPLAEQKRIVAKVDELMALCDRLEAQQHERETRHAALAHASLARFAEAPVPANLNFIFHKSYSISAADLRKSILTLAVQGKLVPQNPNDEPAEELIERIARELTPEQHRRQAAPLSPLPAEALQYELPDNWTWARFRDVAIIASSLVKPDAFLDFTHLAPDNIEKGTGVLLPCATVREDKVISANHRFYRGQVVYSKIRPNLAKVVVVEFDGLCSADMYPIDALIDAFYLQRYMLSESYLVQAVKTATRVAMPKINQMELNAIAVPIPPLAEQRRIVAKVEQLMALVDELETHLAASRAIAADLLEALVVELTAGNHQLLSV